MLKKLKNLSSSAFNALRNLKYYVPVRKPSVNCIHNRAPVFWAGSYRSGKSTMLRVLKKSADFSVYEEFDRNAYKNCRIKSSRTIRRLIETDQNNIVVFELVNDLQYADRFLDVHPNSKLIWVYRNYIDVAKAGVEKWGDAHKNILRGIAKGGFVHPAVDGLKERMKPETVKLIKNIYADEMSSEDGAAFVWYLRNLWFFDLGLDRKDRVLLVSSDDLFLNPVKCLRRIYSFISCPFQGGPTPIADKPDNQETCQPIFNQEIERLCNEMMSEFDRLYYKSRDMAQHSLGNPPEN